MRKKPWILLALCFFLFFSCSRGRVVLFSDPVFTAVLNQSGISSVSRYLRQHSLGFKQVDVPFDMTAEDISLDSFFLNADYILLSPSFTEIFRSLQREFPDKNMYLIGSPSRTVSPARRARDLVDAKQVFRTPTAAIIVHERNRPDFEDLAAAGKEGPQLYFWNPAVGEAGFNLWLSARGNVSAVTFLSADLPASALDAVLEMYDVRHVAHDFTDDTFLRHRGLRSGQLFYTGRDYAELILLTLDSVLSTDGLKSK